MFSWGGCGAQVGSRGSGRFRELQENSGRYEWVGKEGGGGKVHGATSGNLWGLCLVRRRIGVNFLPKSALPTMRTAPNVISLAISRATH